MNKWVLILLCDKPLLAGLFLADCKVCVNSNIQHTINPD